LRLNHPDPRGNNVAESTPQNPESAPAAPQAEVILDDKHANIAYANFARVTATPEEVIMDFALNPNPFMTGRQEIPVAQRLILNFYTAKRLLMALNHTLQRHESTYGSVELNLMRRAQPGALQGAQQNRPPQQS
jgi:hypothetical protein